MSKTIATGDNKKSSSERKSKNSAKGRSPAGRNSAPVFEQERLGEGGGRSPILQAGRVAVSQPNDRWEREAERSANALSQGKSVHIASGNSAGFNLNRMCNSCDDKKKKSAGGRVEQSHAALLFRSKVSTENAVSHTSTTEQSLNQAGSYAKNLSGGQPLPESTRQYFEPRLGRDLSQVRIHHDEAAHRANKTLNAKAFTYGSHIAFRRGNYQPESGPGKHLLAHELSHVAQQGEGVARTIQRELATPPPAETPEAQDDLTDAQIRAALRFNSNRFDDTHTRQIQDIVGTEQTGTFNEDDIRAIARVQENYGLSKDGKIGEDTYEWLITEIQNEALDVNNENCPVAFWINQDGQNIVPRANGANMTHHFTMNADFPSYCNCHDYEYRQFIRGHFDHTQGGVTHDMRSWLADEPSGTLTRNFTEDGNTTVASINFGHRNRGSAPDDLYLNDALRSDRVNGCKYRGDDTPGGNYGGFRSVGGVNVAPATGDRIDILIQFRGEIRLNGTTIITKFWTALRSNFVLP